jgi:crotonobetainyl-CoA:carnitine CoA-transferase CaiB-like acyl-CoA transferase
MQLLKGLKVIDLTTVVLGPFTTQILGDFGAEIIKVESLSGDIYRGVYPQKNPKMGSGFLNVNRNKKSIAINLKTQEGYEILTRLVADADIFVHNMRVSAINRLNLSYQEVSKMNKHIIYCAAPGFGSNGQYANKPAYDDIIQSISGIAGLNKDQHGIPRFVPTILTDKVSGLYALYAILAALHYRSQTGIGVELEVPMYESIVSFLLAEHLQGHIYQPPVEGLGYKRILNKYRRPHQTEDGFLAVMPYSYKNWVDLLTIFDRKDLADEEWMKEASERSRRVAELYQVIGEELQNMPTSYWVSKMEEKSIPCAPVQSLEDLMEDPHLKEVDFFFETEHPSEGPLQQIRQPVKINSKNPDTHSPAPRLGEHTVEVLEKLGYPKKDIQNLVDGQVVSTGVK